MDPSEDLSKVRLADFRGRPHSRLSNGDSQQRSKSMDWKGKLAFYRAFRQQHLLGEKGAPTRKLYDRRSRSQVQYHEVSSKLHLDVTRYNEGDEDAATPDLIWNWRSVNLSAKYQYLPLEQLTDFRLLHVLPATDTEDALHCGFTRYDCRAVRHRSVPFVFVEDHACLYGNRTASIMLNGLPFLVPATLEAMLKSLRRQDKALILFNRSICIGEEYRVCEPTSLRWGAKELEKEVRQLCTLRRARRPNQRLGVVLTWDETSALLSQNGVPFDTDDFEISDSPVDLDRAYKDYELSEKPAVGAQKGSYLRGRWAKWTGEDGTRPWARQLRCRTRSTDSSSWHVEFPRHPPTLPPSEKPSRRARSEQRYANGIRWRGQEFDMDPLWDGLFYMHPDSEDFFWRTVPLPLPYDLPFTHAELDYDREIVLARILEDENPSVIRCGLLRFRWDRLPQFIFIANSMAFNPFSQATIQVNGQFSKISQSLEVCLRSLREAQRSTSLVFAWPLCVPLNRMIDTSWIDAIFCTVYNKAASVIDAQTHLASLYVRELDGFIYSSDATTKAYQRDTSAWNGQKQDESIFPDAESPDNRSNASREASPIRHKESNIALQELSEVESIHKQPEYSEIGSPFPSFLWDQSIWNERREIPTVAFRDYDHRTRTGRLGHVRDAFGSIYCPLDPVSGDVRLVAVLPEDPEDPSRLELEIESRDLTWGYIAISYCWGDSNDQQVISVNGCPFSVRRNLYDFLIYYREAPLTKESRGDAGRFTLWIDALSINQDDRREKTREVRRMNKLYKEADFVLVWLGKEAACIPMDVNDLLDEPSTNEFKLSQVADCLVGNPYFFRAWCTQELTVNKATYVCIGTRWIRWTTFTKLILAAFMPAGLRYVGTLRESSDEDHRMTWLLHSGSAMMRFDIIARLRYRLMCDSPPTLLSLLAATSHCECSVSSDQVYSLWSLASDSAQLLADVNYLKPATELFEDLARNWILKYKRCDILAFVEFPDTSYTFSPGGLQRHRPSWVPDWTLRRASWPLLATWTLLPAGNEVDLRTDEVERQHLYDASGGVSARFKFINTEAELGLLAAGIHVDTLLRVLDPFRGILDVLDWERCCRTWLAGVRAPSGTGDRLSYNDSDLARELDLLDALVAGRHTDGMKRTDLNDSYLDLVQPRDRIVVVKVVEDNEHPERFDSDNNASWVTHFMRVTAGRRLAITKAGQVGLVPASAREGDEVVVLFGCSLPVLFRRAGTTYARIVLGESYFRRMVDGQIIDAAEGEQGSRLALPPELREGEAVAGKAALFKSVESLSELFPDPMPESTPSAQWFCIK